MKTIKLVVTKNALVDGGLAYKVIAVKNSTDYHPNIDFLTRAEVDNLCHNPRWEVNIVGAN